MSPLVSKESGVFDTIEKIVWKGNPTDFGLIVSSIEFSQLNNYSVSISFSIQ
jgi:hypothetical protein